MEVFKGYFDTYFDCIRSFLYYKSGDVDLAEDLVQEVFMKLWENIHNIKHETVKSYLYTIASNLFKNHYKRKKVEFKFIANFSELDSESPEFLMELKEFDKVLQGAISKIPEKSRDVFLMNRIEKLTYNEIAERLKISVKAVEKRMSKAISILRELIDYKI